MNKFYKNETAIVDEGASIGENTKLWHWTHIRSSAVIGKNCNLGQNVYIDSNVKIGNNVKIQNNVSVYDGVIIENNVFVGPSVVFTNVKNPRSEVDRRNEFLSTLVKEGVTIGANATIVCGVLLGNYSFIASGAVVTSDVQPHALMAGVPAKLIGWMDSNGIRVSQNPEKK